MSKKKPADIFGLDRSLVFLALALLSFLVGATFLQVFDHDEFEWIHSAWLISKGQQPYLDFFQHHHSLSYVIGSWFFSVFPESFLSVFLFRGIYLVLAIFNLGILYKITRFFSDRSGALLACIIFLSTYPVLYSISVIRPDSFLMVFGLASALLFLSHVQNRSSFNLVLSGILAALAFAALQKAVVWIGSFGVLALGFLIHKKILWKDVLVWVLSFCFALVVLWFWLSPVPFEEYVFYNWTLNFAWGTDESLKWELLKWAAFSWHYVLLIPIAFVWALKKKSGFVFLALAGALPLVVLAVFGNPYRQYFLMALPLEAIVIATYLREILVLKRYLVPALFVLALLPYVLMLSLNNYERRSLQIDRVEFVLANSTSEDVIWDGNADINLFRPDVDFFWFSTSSQRGGVKAYQELRPLKFEPVELIGHAKPKFVWDKRLDDKEFLKANYVETKFQGLWKRKE